MIDQRFIYVAFCLSMPVVFLLATPIILVDDAVTHVLSLLTSSCAAIGCLVALRTKRRTTDLIEKTGFEGHDILGADAWSASKSMLWIAIASFGIGALHALAKAAGIIDVTHWISLVLSILFVWSACGLVDICLHGRKVRSIRDGAISLPRR